jgi:hypothetical protein
MASKVIQKSKEESKEKPLNPKLSFRLQREATKLISAHCEKPLLRSLSLIVNPRKKERRKKRNDLARNKTMTS